jgi:hypothetical protein
MTEHEQDPRSQRRENPVDARSNRREPGEPAAVAPAARVRDEDLEPHEGLRYIAKLFKALALLLIFMLIAEVVIGFQQDGTAALGNLLVEATRLIVFAGFLWGIGDMAVILIESNHDLRASRILLGRLNGKMERLIEVGSGSGAGPASGPGTRTGSPPPVPSEPPRMGAPRDNPHA